MFLTQIPQAAWPAIYDLLNWSGLEYDHRPDLGQLVVWGNPDRGLQQAAENICCLAALGQDPHQAVEKYWISLQ